MRLRSLRSFKYTGNGFSGFDTDSHDCEEAFVEFLGVLRVVDLVICSELEGLRNYQVFKALPDLRRLYVDEGRADLYDARLLEKPRQVKELWLHGCLCAGGQEVAEIVQTLPEKLETLVLCCPGNDMVAWLGEQTPLIVDGEPAHPYLPAHLRNLRFEHAHVQKVHVGGFTGDYRFYKEGVAAQYYESAVRLDEFFKLRGIQVKPASWVDKLEAFLDRRGIADPHWRDFLQDDGESESDDSDEEYIPGK